MNNTELMWQAMDNIDKMLDKLGIPKEPPKGSFYDLSADEEESAKRKPGGQPGNQNARKHGFYSRSLTQEQRGAYRTAKYGPSLTPEIAIMRLIVRDIMADPDADQDLLLRSVRTLARLLHVQGQLRNVS